MSTDRSGTPAVPRALRGTAGVVLDTDGVITDSARVHAAAWKTAFDGFLHDRGPGEQRPFDVRDDYLTYVDGKSRLDGAAAFLRARGLRPTDAEIQSVAARKERLFTEHLRAEGVDAYPGTVRLLRTLRAAGIPLAAASASRHAGELLGQAGVRELFDTLVDGTEAARLHLPGKPDPALFLEATRRLGVPADRAAVIEDALAGVEAGRRGGFGLVVGVDRADTPDTRAALLKHGADLVVADLAELFVSED
ncbi:MULTISPECIES: HAD-IA family hydrolase [unclassified Streptomyces]|uniref:HAD family hydrolase n=1 Tax=unclassified Streptomyces TaxID=2593676 RepID=UPI002E8149CB|nr:HAD-IA family hydrolase [Streptomyces sp. NBC_00589]WTI34278.1 HAD-IA family hydrolase [Streptomyces sp. NBC_00775]WUB32050.1 HAD-IA family hydrolase [Streptomyces sp. NBC_00589]